MTTLVKSSGASFVIALSLDTLLGLNRLDMIIGHMTHSELALVACTSLGLS